MEEVSGTVLAGSFKQWRYRAGSPVVEWGWEYKSCRHQAYAIVSWSRLPIKVGILVEGSGHEDREDQYGGETADVCDRCG
jgi:hypothetical protein